MDEFMTKAEHREFAERIDSENKRQNKRIGDLEDGIKGITQVIITIERLATNVENMQKELCEQSQRLKAIEDKPKNDWDKVKWLVIGAVVSVAVATIWGLITK